MLADRRNAAPSRRLTRSAILAIVTCLIGGLVSATWGTATANAGPPPPPPSSDAFYDLPANWTDSKPGDILRSRPVDLKSLQLLPLNVDAWQLLYRSTDEKGEPYAAVTTVMVPSGPVKPRPLLSYQMASDSVMRICNPSYGLTSGAPIDFSSPAGPLPFALPAGEIVFAAAGLEQGWAVTMPDYGGLDNRFLTPRQPGFAVLDGIRATTNFAPAGLAGTETPVGMWGYSGGAIASSWAVEEHPTYAPEINIKGAAFGAPERDLEPTIYSVNQTPGGGLLPVALGAILKDRPELLPIYDKYLTPAGVAIVNETRNHCLPQNLLTHLWFDYRPYLKAPIDVVLADPTIKRELADRGISGKAPTAPLYIYNGVTEEVSPIVGADKLVNSYCAGGTPVTYRRETFPPAPGVPQIWSTHATLIFTGAPNAFAWLKQRLAPGAPTPTGCDIQTIPTTVLDQEALATLGPSFIGNSILALLGQPLGPAR